MAQILYKSTTLLCGDMITPAQCRMARAALRVNIRDLALDAKVSPTTITHLERGDTLYDRTNEAIQAIFEERGVVFFKSPDGKSGIIFED